MSTRREKTRVSKLMRGFHPIGDRWMRLSWVRDWLINARPAKYHTQVERDYKMLKRQAQSGDATGWVNNWNRKNPRAFRKLAGDPNCD